VAELITASGEFERAEASERAVDKSKALSFYRRGDTRRLAVLG